MPSSSSPTQIRRVVQHLCAKAWAARRRYRRDIAAFGTWLLAIARNVAIDHLRTARSHAPLDAAAESDALESDESPEADGALASDVARLAGLVASLPKRDQELLALKYGAEATNRDIARLMGLTESNVGTLLHRAVRTLRRRW